MPEGAVPRRFGQPDSHSSQRVFRPQSAHWRIGRGEVVCRPGRGLVRGAVRRHAAAARGTRPAHGGLPTRDRLADPQAGRVRELCLPRRSVPDDAVPPGLRPLLRRPRRAERSQGLPEDPAPRGPQQRSRHRRRVARSPGEGHTPVTGCGDRVGEVRCGTSGRDGGRRGTAGPEGVRCPVDTHGGDSWRRRRRLRRTRRRRRNG